LAETKAKLYEAIALYHPDLEEETIKERAERVEQVVREHAGNLVSTNIWKKRKLAYPIKKQAEGNYVVYRFTGDRRLLPDLDYILRYDEECLRYLIIDVGRYPGMTRGTQRTEVSK